MHRIKTLLSSSIGQKFFMAVTGLALLGFLIAHMGGNLLMFAGPESYNAYSEALVSNPAIYLAEFILGAFFVWHLVTGVLVTRRNRAARPVAYEHSASAGAPSRKSLASTTMILSGVVLLVFVPLHLKTFKFGPSYEAASDAGIRDLHRLVIEVFESPGHLLWYVVALALLGFHAWHGFGSAFESLGVGYSQGLRRFGQGLALVIVSGFLLVPLAIYLGTI